MPGTIRQSDRHIKLGPLRAANAGGHPSIEKACHEVLHPSAFICDARCRAYAALLGSSMNAPPFNAGPVAGRDDYTTEQGARRLGHMIADAWRKCGVDLHFEVVGVGLGKDGRFASFSPRFPQLLNGLPRK